MKRLFYLSVLILITILSDIKPLKATHYMGGEITWECLTNGKYRFKLKAYRECYYGTGAAANFGASVVLSSNSPVSSITLTEITGWPKDISPTCNTNPNFPHIICVGMTNSAQIWVLCKNIFIPPMQIILQE